MARLSSRSENSEKKIEVEEEGGQYTVRILKDEEALERRTQRASKEVAAGIGMREILRNDR